MGVDLKKLVFIGGPMGSGKTTLAEKLLNELPNSVMLDGDWCWMQGRDWKFDSESRDMALKNIRYVLSNYLRHSGFEFIIFSWVMHDAEIYESILAGLSEFKFEFINISLVLSEKELVKRLRGRGADDAQIERSIERLGHYASLNTRKLDVTHMSVEETVYRAKNMILGLK